MSVPINRTVHSTSTPTRHRRHARPDGRTRRKHNASGEAATHGMAGGDVKTYIFPTCYQVREINGVVLFFVPVDMQYSTTTEHVVVCALAAESYHEGATERSLYY